MSESRRALDGVPPELAPVIAWHRLREGERDRTIARLGRTIAERDAAVRRLQTELADCDLRRIAEVGAIRYDMEKERGKNAELREKLAHAETARRAAVRDVLDAKLSFASQSEDRRLLEDQLADARAEIALLRRELEALRATSE
ncbi:MAG: hypothetical protein AABZ30_01110 [Myxococcota bacterium]